ncbi:hypothetical protein H6G80_28745 [Nostoc sp. FACHB-87]|uniref:hypothetical protein n=1 Tax=Nostocales TaxID=1161 RepID=UPI0016899633|nr:MULTISPECIES: hypothetical protein [Nostocales]MBD2303155.1 hypothetical protein [Nostoc sp. FACHB-190]MBD2458041.1 hypothetical protein [Nostoc sp. FACHB-87]MBD2479273.1 hypothetical protein [Anabaena sp. FACHB-83]MBD2492333.1 hypothetical protein [Aulosira sp. FACHB-615]
MEPNNYRIEYKFHSIIIAEESLSRKAYYYKIYGELCHNSGFANSVEEAEKEAKEKIDEKFNLIDKKAALHRYSVMRDFESFVETLLHQQPEISQELAYNVAAQLALASTLKYFTKEVLSSDVKDSGTVDAGGELNTDNLPQ